MNNEARGFTLVEALVAVAIVALALTALLTVMMRQIDGAAYLRDKVFANWVALNQLELARLANAHSNQLPQDTSYGSEEMAGRTWYWRAVPKPTQFGAVQLEIIVSDKDDKSAPGIGSVLGILDTAHRMP